MDGDPLYNKMRKRVAVIRIMPVDGEEIYQSGIIVDCGSNFAYVIADPRRLVGEIGVKRVTIIFPDEQELDPPPQLFCTRNGIVGILCYGSFDTDLVKKMDICTQPLVMTQEVCVYEGVYKNITEGNVTLFQGDHFSHNCTFAYLAEYGAPVVTKAGKLVGICDSGEYHLSAKNIFSFVDTIGLIKSTLLGI